MAGMSLGGGGGGVESRFQFLLYHVVRGDDDEAVTL